MRKPTAKQKLLAEKVILEGKSFRQGAIEAGYSQIVADKGPNIYAADKPGLQAAFILAAQKADINAETVKQVSKYRLFDDVVKAKDSGVTRQIELLGRMKEHDWFVRNTDVQIGVFASLADDSKIAGNLESLTASLPTDKTEDK